MSKSSKLKIVWLCSQPLNSVANEFGYESIVFGGWLEGISSLIKGQIDFYYIFPSVFLKGVKEVTKDKINFVGISKDNNFVKNYQIKISEINPDIIHIFGTENIFLDKVLIKNDLSKSIISIQGVMNTYSKLFYSNVNKYHKFYLSKNVLFWLTLVYNKQRYIEMAKFENKVLLKSFHVIGRTNFDKEFISKYKEVKYYKNYEILRSEFYISNKWDFNNINRFQIFVSQGNYPIKGLHILLKAISLLKNEFPDIKVIVSGENVLKGYGLAYKFGFSYGNFIDYIIKNDKLEKHVEFVGFKNANEVIELLLKSHLFVIPSSIENSPNSLGEAMLLGVPSVCSNVGGIPSMVDNTTSILYEFSDAYKLASSIKRILLNDELAISLSKESIIKGTHIFDREKNASELLKIYNEIKSQLS